MKRTRSESVRLASGLAVASLAALGCGGGSSRASRGPSAAGSSAAGSTTSSTSSSTPSAAGVQRAPLSVSIPSPLDGVEVPPLVPLTLTGSAVDATGAPVPASGFSWSSSLDGPIGQGNPVVWASPTPGLHLVTLTAATAAGAGGHATVRVEVQGAGGPGSLDLGVYAQDLLPALFGRPLSLTADLFDRLETNKTDLNAVSGSGGLTVGVSRSGVITTLRWPSPVDPDHVDWMSIPGRAPGYGILESQGVFAGVCVTTASGPLVSWFREPGWNSAQRYLDDDGAVVTTVHESVALGLRATETTFVHPQQDVLVQTVRLEALTGGPTQARLLFYENLAPCTFRMNYLPLGDWLLDILNDYAAGWSTRESAVVHFRPEGPSGFADYRPAYAFAKSASSRSASDVDAWLDAAPTTLGPGVYAAIGGDQPPSGFQVGADAQGNGPASGAGPIDAYADARDGVFSGNLFAAGRADAGQSFDLDLTQGPATRTLYTALGPDLNGPTGAFATLSWARSRTADQLLSDTRTWWSAQLAGAHLPNTSDASVVKAAQRSLVTILNARDRRTGAISAGIATQLPYALDWCRDGSFINYALDTAGFPQLVAQHEAFYASVQRRTGPFAGTYEMNYMSNGHAGGPVPLEIDECALACWSMSLHRTFEPDPARRAAYLASVYPAIQRSADFLTRWRDPLNGLALPANEDDCLYLTAGLHGSSVILTALDSAVDAGVEAGETVARLDEWRGRRAELAAAVEHLFWDSSVSAFRDSNTTSNSGIPWILWPSTLLVPGDPRAAQQADYLQGLLDSVFVAHSQTISGYDAKLTLAIATRFAQDPTRRAAVERTFKTMLAELPTPDTGHMGEFYRLVPGPAGPQWEPANDTPHVWEHSLIYLTAMKLYP